MDNLSRQSTNKSLSELEKYNNQLRQGKVNLKNVEVTGDIFNFTVNRLQYFQDYEFHVCRFPCALFSSSILFDPFSECYNTLKLLHLATL